MRPQRLIAAGYGALGLLVAGPLLSPGLVLAVDSAPVPHPALDPSYWGLGQGTHEGTVSRLPLDALLTAVGWVTSVAVAQKLVLVASIALAGWGMHRLVEGRHPAARVFAGLLYAINPFVYERIWTGQLSVVLGYALLPWAFAAFRQLLRGDTAAPWRFIALTLATGIASAHMALLLGLLCACAMVAVALGKRRTPATETTRSVRSGGWRALWPALLGCGLAVLACAWWLLPTPGVTDLWNHVGRAQLSLYASVGDPHFGLIPAVAALSGYWNDATPAISSVPGWPGLVATLVVLAAGGLWLQRRDPICWGVAAAALCGFLLALGYAWAPTRAPFTWLLAHVPPLRSFRESGKGLALVAFAYAYLGSAAVADLVLHTAHSRRARAVVAVLMLCVPVGLGLRELWGDFGQLHTSRYPVAWTQADSYLTRVAQNSRTLVLPFHGYLGLSFAHDRVVANPAASYFRTPTLVSRSVGGPEDQSDAEQAQVEALLASATGRTDFTACLASLGVSRVLLLHQADWTAYAALARRPGISLERSWPGVTLYRSDQPTSLVMARTRRGHGCADWTPIPAARSGALGIHLLASPPRGAALRVELPDSGAWQRNGARSFTYGGWGVYERNYVLGLLLFLLAFSPLWARPLTRAAHHRRGKSRRHVGALSEPSAAFRKSL